MKYYLSHFNLSYPVLFQTFVATLFAHLEAKDFKMYLYFDYEIGSYCLLNTKYTKYKFLKKLE